MKEILTRVAYCGVDEYRFCGHSVFGELIGESYLGVAALSLLNRRLDPQEQQLLDLMSVILTAADPRIWPLKAGRLVAAYGSPESGLLAANLCLIGSKMGSHSIAIAAALLVDIRADIDDEQVSSDELCDAALGVMRKYRRVPGFGVPGRRYDKRLLVLDEHIRRLKRHHRPYYETKSAVIRAARELSIRVPPNIALGAAAACLDMGFSPEDMEPLGMLFLLNAVLANAVESAREPSSEMKRLPASRVRYIGPPERQSPRKTLSDKASGQN